MRKTSDFTLATHLSGDGGICFIAAECSLAGEAGISFPKEVLEDLAREPMSLKDLQPDRLREDGSKIFDAVMGCPGPAGEGPIGKLFNEARERAWREDLTLRVVIAIPAAPTTALRWLHALPWELMYDSSRGRFLATDPDLAVVRYLQQRNPVPRFRRGGQLKVLVSTACPEECPPLRIHEEAAQLQEMFRWQRLAPVLKPKFLEKATRIQLKRRFDRAEEESEPFHVWHHCGHGRFTGEDEIDYELALHAENQASPQAAEWIDAVEIAKLVSHRGSLQLVVFNVCHAADPRGLASRLAELGLPAVAGFTAPVKDSRALDFSRELWRALTMLPVDQAIQRTRQVLAVSPDPTAFCRLILYLRTLEPLSLSAAPVQT